MGYSTEFLGYFKIDQPVDDETFALLRGITGTRRMMRKMDSSFGIDGEFYVGDEETFPETIVDVNVPPRSQPGLNCDWEIMDDRQTIEWTGGEKFYNYIEWIEYWIKRILQPKKYVVNGAVAWLGEDSKDTGLIGIIDNFVFIEQNMTNPSVIQLLTQQRGW